MQGKKGPKAPSRPTTKGLFAFSGNLCAFPKCNTPLVDMLSKSIVGEMCHIKGEKPGSARYDSNQTNEKRHDFDNLILLCNVHHKIVDDDEVAYTVERLVQMKQQHESRHASTPVDEAASERFVAMAISNSTIHGSVIATHGQTGGQAAHQINNYYGTTPAEESIRLEGKLESAVGLDVLTAFGCPGLRLTVICRSTRPAKIKTAHLLIGNVDVMPGFQQGFGGTLGYRPVEGTKQTMDVELIPMSQPNSQEGYILNRDDVARFFYPLPMPATTLALRAIESEVSITVKNFDDSEQTMITGDEIKGILEGLFQVFRERPGDLKVPIRIAVRVKQQLPPGPEMAEMIGKLNKNYVPIAKPPDTSSQRKADGENP